MEMIIKTEKHLLELLKNDSNKAYTCLYNKWAPLLHRFVFSLVKSRSMTEDIVQETFVKIWDNRRNIETDKSFKSYLFTITYHMVLKEFRYQVNHPQMEDYIALTNDIEFSESPDIHQLDFDYFISELDKAKLLLSPRQREIFELNKEENLSVKEIVEKLQITEQVVRNQLSASLKIIRQKLAKSFFILFFWL